jgi:hypothetical protein
MPDIIATQVRQRVPIIFANAHDGSVSFQAQDTRTNLVIQFTPTFTENTASGVPCSVTYTLVNGSYVPSQV